MSVLNLAASMAREGGAGRRPEAEGRGREGAAVVLRHRGRDLRAGVYFPMRGKIWWAQQVRAAGRCPVGEKKSVIFGGNTL
jgi:hypothetical protein